MKDKIAGAGTALKEKDIANTDGLQFCSPKCKIQMYRNETSRLSRLFIDKILF